MNTVKQKALLFILPLIPYPLRAHGISVRYLPLLQHLANEFALDLIIIGDGSGQTDRIKALEEFCRRVLMVPDPRYASHSLSEKIRTQMYLLLPWTPPSVNLVYGADRLARDLTGIVAGELYESVIWVTSHHTAVLFTLMRAVACDRLIIDFIDSPTLCLRRRVYSLSPAWLHQYHTWKMKHWERRLGREASKVIYISEDDYRPIGSDQPEKVRFIPNGVSIEGYSPAIAGSSAGPSIGYIGNMGYEPNTEAVFWLYREVFLPLRRQIPELVLTIIGKNPTAEIRALAAEEGITVTGAVDEIWPYINGVEVFAFPILRGAGVKNKILEAMYARRPVVTTPIGNEGINGISGRDLLVCRPHSEEFQEKIRQLLVSSERRQEIGEAAHRFVAEKFLWPGILQQFEAAIVNL